MPVNTAARRSKILLAAVVCSLAPGQAGAQGPTQAACASAYEDAQVLRQSGRLIKAREAALECARPACPAVARRDCESWAAELGREIPSIVVIARDDSTGNELGARVVVDGVARPEAATGRAFELDPGQHTVRVERDGDEPLQQTIAVFQGERDRIIRFALQPTSAQPTPAAARTPEAPVAAPAASASPSVSTAEPSSRSYVPAIVVGGASLAALGASAWLGLTGRSDLSNLRSTCAPACTDSQVDPVRRKLLLSDVSLGVGVFGAAVAVFLFTRSQGATPQVSSTRVDVEPTRAGATLSMHTRF